MRQTLLCTNVMISWFNRLTDRLTDELPMIYASCFMLYALQSTRLTTGINALLLSTSLFAFSVFVTVSYLDHKNVIFHEVAYGILVCNSSLHFST